MDQQSTPAAAEPRRHRHVRRLRAGLFAAVALASGATCRDSSPTGPGLPQPASLAVAPVFQSQGPQGGPRMRLSRIRARIHAHPSASDTIERVVQFVNDTATIEVELQLTSASQLFGVHLAGIGAAGDTLFRGSDTVRAVANADVRPASLRLQYAGPDAGVAAITLSPRDTTIDAPDSLRLRAAAVGSEPPTLYVGWTSRDTVALRISDSGTVRPRSIERSVWVVARLYNGVTDSTLVHVRAPVAAVVLQRDTATLVRGDSLRLAAEPRDSSGAALAGRTVTWSALDTTVTVDGTGMVRARTARTTGRVVASVGTRSDTAVVTILPRPAAAVVATPDSVAVVVGATTQLSAQVLDAAQQPNPDHTVTWSSADSTVARVSASGLVTGASIGRTRVHAVSGAFRDSVLVSVTAPAGALRIGGFRGARGGGLSIAGGQYYAGARAAALQAYPNAVFVGLDSLTAQSLSGVDILMLGTWADWGVPAAPLTAAEQGAFQGWVRGGGPVIILTDDVVNGAAAASASLLDWLGVGMGGFVGGVESSPVASPSRSMLTSGSFGTAGTFDVGYFSAITTAGPHAVVLATSSIGGTLAVIEPGTLQAGSGGIAIYTDVMAIADTINSQRPGFIRTNRAVFQNTLAFLRAPHAASVAASPRSLELTVGGRSQFAATVRDAQGAALAGRIVTWRSLSEGVATVDASGAVTAVATGTARIALRSGAAVDTVTVTVSSTQATITRTDVTPAADTAVSLGDTLVFAAQAYRDTTPVAGTFTWTSRAPGIATVDSAGRVVAVANGSTYVVATEAGGTLDSALVLVQQRVSTVSVTPVQVTRYLGRTQQFAASAVDGRGNPVGSARFAWSSTAPAVATVDTTGLASFVGLGNAVVRASSGGITGQADVTVISPISRIVVSPDSVTLDAFGRTQGYTATAYDTLDAPMSNISFAWASSNPSVASLSGTTATGTTATASANGTTRIGATAQGVTGTALLTVRQTLSAIEVSPATAAVAPGGRVVFTARGRDPLGSYLTTNPTFAWSSDNTAIATVDASGVVTGGNTQGAASIRATSGQLTGAATVQVSNEVPQKVSFGRDTIKLGRATSNQIPVYLSVPSQSMVIVTLTARDTIAYFTKTVDTIPAGQTSRNVTINTRNAGSTRIVVTGPTGWAPDSSVVTVQANVRFSTTGMSMVATDQRSAQVLLSDPAPPGGLYVTYQASVANVVQISPEPAFVPAGQLAADIVVRGVTPGGTVITPVAAGANGANTLSVNVQAAALAWYYGAGPTRLGAGQYQPNPNYVYIGTALSYPLTVTLTSSDTGLVRTQSQVVIPAGGTTAGVTVRAVAVSGNSGSATIVASAPGFASSGGYQIRVSPPRVDICCATNMNTTSGPVSLQVYAQDSLGNAGYRINSLRVAVRSSDTMVVKVASDTAVIGADQYYVNTTVRPGGSGGTAWIHVSAAGHGSDSVQVNVSAPALRFYYAGNGQTTRVIGAGQWDQNVDYVQLPNALASPVTITLTSSDSTIAKTTRTVIMPAGSTTVPFNHYGLRTGLVTITASATGYTPATYGLRVTTPHIDVCCTTSMPMYRTNVSATVYARDSVNNVHNVIDPLAVSWRVSADTSVLGLDSASTTIATNQYYNSAQRIRPKAPGTAWVVATAAGWGTDSFQVTVTPAALGLYYGQNGRVGARQLVSSGNYLTIPDARGDTVVATVTQRNPAVSRLVQTTVRIRPGVTTEPIHWEGVAPGVDTLTYTAPGYTPVNFIVRVTTRSLRINDMNGSLTTTSPTQNVIAYTVDSLGTQHVVADTVRLHFVSTNSSVLQVDTIVRIVRGAVYTPNVPVRVVGAGTARVVVRDSTGLATPMAPDTTNLVTVTGPALRFYYGNTISTGMRQRATTADYVAIPNPLASPLTVTLASSDPRVAVPTATVVIPAGSTTAPFDVTGGDTVGTIQITATATGYSPANTTTQVGRPRLLLITQASATTTSPPGAVTVYLQDQSGNSRQAADSFSVTLVSTQPGVVAPDSAVLTFRPGMTYHNTSRLRYLSTGSAQVMVTDGRQALYAYAPDTVGVTVSMPVARLYYAGPGTTIPLGIGQQWQDYVYIPNGMADTIGVTFTHNTARSSFSPNPAVLSAGQTTRLFTAQGLSTGVDTVRVGARAHASSTVYLNVGPGNLQLSGWPGTLRVGDSVAVRVYTYDPANNNRPVAAATAVTVTGNGSVRFADAQGATIGQVTVPAGQPYSAQFWVHGVASGTGVATLSATNYNSATFNTAVP